MSVVARCTLRRAGRGGPGGLWAGFCLVASYRVWRRVPVCHEGVSVLGTDKSTHLNA